MEISILKKKHGKIDFFQTLPYASVIFVKIRENADTAAKLLQNTDYPIWVGAKFFQK